MRARLLVAALLSAWLGVAQAAGTDAAPAAADSLQQQLMTHVLVLRGAIDGRAIQLSLQPKKNEDGLEGHYFFFGGSPDILVAGEVDGDNLIMEESVNGRDVSGQWDGHRDGRTIVGTWSSADGTLNKPFSLQLP